MIRAADQGQRLAVQRVGAALQRVPIAHRFAALTLQAVGKVRRRVQIRRYLNEVPPHQRVLVIGAAAMTIDGALCSDLIPVKRSVVYLDAAKRWPLPSASFQYVVCEHMIAQVTYDAGLAVLREARRVLLPRGVLRISTEDLDVVRRLPDTEDLDARRYIQWSNRTFGTPSQQMDASNPAHVLNRLMRSWGHTYLYDEATLRRALDRAGFVDVVRCKPDESLHAELARVDRHATLIGEVANRVESMILEAMAP